MRVKITYSVDLEDVPKFVNKKLTEVSNDLDYAKYQINPDSLGPDNLKKLDTIDAVRRKLAVLDSQLEDCYSILAGYNKALADMRVPTQDQQQEHQNG